MVYSLVQEAIAPVYIYVNFFSNISIDNDTTNQTFSAIFKGNAMGENKRINHEFIDHAQRTEWMDGNFVCIV